MPRDDPAQLLQGEPTSAQLRALDRRDPALGRARRRVAPFPKLPNKEGGQSHFHALARSIAKRPNEEIIEELVAVRGIGRWTAQMFLMFRLARLDILAPLDLGLQEGLKRLDGLDERPKPKELEARGACWSPLGSVASWVLWRLTEE